MTRSSAEAVGPRDLVFTLFGEYLLKRSDSVWVGSLITLLEPFDLTEGTVRTALSRMVKKGWLSARREGRHAFYSLTPRGRRLLEEGTERIFHPDWREAWDGRWFLLTYSLPQGDRSVRDRLRDRLAWLGFGSMGNGVWVSPHDVTDEVEELADTLGLGDRYLAFRAERVAGAGVDEIVTRCWDLPALADRYRDFARRWKAVLHELGHEPPGPERGFRLRFELIHEYRRFPLEDPFLPRTLLPHPWPGEEAARLFREVHDRLVGPADAHVDAVLAEELAA